MAPINPDLLQKIQAKLGVSKKHAYRLIAQRANETFLPRNLAAVAFAGELGINTNKGAYATDAQRAQISAALAARVQPQVPSKGGPAQFRRTAGPPRAKTAAPKRKSNSVMVVHGRDIPARDALYGFLRALGLRPIEFSQGVKATKKGAPHVGEVLGAMFAGAAAVVVLLTPDDDARLRAKFRKASDADFESKLTGQARPNVLFEAGRAFGSHPDSTILVQVGEHRPMSDLAGVHILQFDGSPRARNDLAQRLEAAGCAVDQSGGDWLTAGKFGSKPRENRRKAR